MTTEKWKAALREAANPAKTPVLQRFFKTAPGEYAEGDVFIGLTVPANRAISRPYHILPVAEIAAMLTDPVHEFRLAGFLALVEKYRKARTDSERDAVADFYLAHGHHADNWDLVDLSSPYILGEEIAAGRRLDALPALLASDCLWRQRIGVVAMLTPIRRGQLDLPLQVCAQMLGHGHDLMRKATGWVLREIGKKDEGMLRAFLDANIGALSSITLSYATERLDPESRRRYRQMRAEAAPRKKRTT